MSTLTAPDPLVEALMNCDEKAEIIDEKIVKKMSIGKAPNRAAGRIYISLTLHADAQGQGDTATDNAGFLCDLPNRGSFSPDAAFYTGPENPDSDMDFYPEPPIFAVEVRSKNDYGRRADIAITQKIADYFAAGTLVVWDVDLQAEEVIAKYSAAEPMRPQIFRRGEIADAQPAVPGWTMPVDELFAPQRRTSI